MAKSKWVERRTGRKHDLTLRRSFLFYVPKKTAYGFITIGFALAVLTDIWAPSSVWMGPLYLFLVAFAAWTISGLLAVGLGTLAIAFTWATSGMSLYPYGPEFAFANVAIRFLCVLMIIAFLVIARRSSEREWKLARLDLLTGGLNRPAFFETIEASNYEHDWCALAYADLDGLKRVNDEQGHEAGDNGIKAFAETVGKAIRKGDIFARLGGDEFVVFMKVDGPENGQMIADRLNEETNAGNPLGRGALPCSWGVLLLPPGPRRIDLELKAADALMYRAKKSQAGLAKGIYNVYDGQITMPASGYGQNHEAIIRSSVRSPI
ncbi:GGDEF domain-containing protein [Croceicoccus ponticola]|uniref:diguanylate cyclase n=1 Tax=Croceicoccus ponticola TaxID=2217664 RepID=A0A437H023_9SPHN|nr:GGDEF domain-containing protein [Croceicoccus ponticola]RVQ68961.1 GGDEF domain-containing protein [Croceicoccus ponticola]